MRYALLGVVVAVLTCTVGIQGQSDIQLDSIELPRGFTIDVYADGLDHPRSMVMTPSGSLFVGTRADTRALATGNAGPEAGKVYAIQYLPGARRASEVITIARGLYAPNGVAFRNGALYVAEINRVLRFDNIESHLDNPPKPVVVSDEFPGDFMHGWKYIAFGPDGKLYVPVGAPCNVCDHSEDEPKYASITRMNPDGSDLEVFASGIRNSVGFDWDPVTQEIWFTSNGRDMLGDTAPPDTLNHAATQGLHFGFPYCHGGTIPDPEFGESRPCDKLSPPARNLGPHVAALGMRFYTGDMFPKRYKNQIFIAEHGSWNRSPAAGHTGYRITVVHLDNGRPLKYEVFAEGWLQSDNLAWGRPVDVLVAPDGALLISDDRAGAIYRVSYTAEP